MMQLTSRLLTLALLCAAMVLTGFSSDAEARRLGGGRSFGMQRQATPAPTPAPTPSVAPKAPAAPTAAAPTAAAPTTPPRRSWLGPIAGLAAGLGLAALASHFGFGEELASVMLMALLAVVVLFVLRRVFSSSARSGGMAYAGNTPAPSASPVAAAFPGSTAAEGPVPADFDREGFARQAKLNFIRLQAANDRGDLNDLREFTTPELFAEIALQFDERGRGAQQTDVVTLDAEVIEVATEGPNHVVSVRFHGLLREEGDAHGATPFDEIWHLLKPTDGSRGWVVAGIQQRH